LDHIPSIGYSSWPLSYITSFKYVSNAVQILQEGYAKYKGAPFKVPTLNRWIVVIGRQHLEDIKKSTDDELSLIEVANNSAKVDYLIGPEINSNPYHISIARIHLTRNLGLYYPDIKDEVHAAFEKLLDLKADAWKSVPAVETVREIVCRASNRVFVGLPRCTLIPPVSLVTYFFFQSRQSLRTRILPSLVSKKLPKTATGIARAMKHLDPIVKEHLKCAGERKDDWSDKPNDILQWLIDEKQESSTRQLALRVWTVNFASIHVRLPPHLHKRCTNLSAYPQYVGPLREEVDALIREHGWKKEAIALMRKVDKFLAETQRLEGVLTSSVQRKAMKDLTLSDGTFVPKGTHLCIPTYVFHRDGAVYENPGVFNPFRFSQLSDDEGVSARHQMVGVTQDYFPFGFGKHAWCYALPV
ncbi:hypothetical protein PISMIDRAFT_101818, partial [Pisolithus microcarpus 441]